MKSGRVEAQSAGARRGLHPRMNARKTMLELAFEFQKGLDLVIFTISGYDVCFTRDDKA
jgi:hypothetical protein